MTLHFTGSNYHHIHTRSHRACLHFFSLGYFSQKPLCVKPPCKSYSCAQLSGYIYTGYICCGFTCRKMSYFRSSKVNEILILLESAQILTCKSAAGQFMLQICCKLKWGTGKSAINPRQKRCKSTAKFATVGFKCIDFTLKLS